MILSFFFLLFCHVKGPVTIFPPKAAASSDGLTGLVCCDLKITFEERFPMPLFKYKGESLMLCLFLC